MFLNVRFGEKSGRSGPSDLASDPLFILEAKIPEVRRDRTIGVGLIGHGVSESNERLKALIVSRR